MSVLIKGMDMPKKCSECKLKYRHQGAYVTDHCFPSMKKIDPWTFGETWNGGKPKWCPLVEVPKHVRLIDANAFEIMGYKDTEGRANTFDDGVIWMLERIDDEPTVIEED